MLDTLQIIFWSITYVLIIIAGFQSFKIKKVSIPYFAALQNFTWEFCALLNSRGFWGHIAWFSLDLIIILFGFLYIRSKKNKVIFAATIPAGITLFFFAFTIPNGMLYSSLIIDLLMAVYFLVDREKLSPKLKVPIAITKLLGDTFAGLYYAPESDFVGILAGLVFVCNICYLYLCIEETRTSPKNKKKKKNDCGTAKP